MGKNSLHHGPVVDLKYAALIPNYSIRNFKFLLLFDSESAGLSAAIAGNATVVLPLVHPESCSGVLIQDYFSGAHRDRSRLGLVHLASPSTSVLKVIITKIRTVISA